MKVKKQEPHAYPNDKRLALFLVVYMLKLVKCSMCESEVNEDDGYCPYCGEPVSNKQETRG